MFLYGYKWNLKIHVLTSQLKRSVHTELTKFNSTWVENEISWKLFDNAFLIIQTLQVSAFLILNMWDLTLGLMKVGERLWEERSNNSVVLTAGFLVGLLVYAWNQSFSKKAFRSIYIFSFSFSLEEEQTSSLYITRF